MSLAVPALSTFYLGLVLVVLGTGLLKPNISVIVGQLYTEKDIRRDAGFSIFYMGINTGAFVGPLITGYLAQDVRFRGIIEGWGMDPEFELALGLRRRWSGDDARPSAVRLRWPPARNGGH